MVIRSVYSKFVMGQAEQDKNRSCFKVVICFAIPENEQRVKKRNPPIPNSLSSYPVCLSPSNHSSVFDVPSESFTMILHTTPHCLLNQTTPHHPMSQHLRPLPYHYKLYCHHYTTLPHFPPMSPNISAFL